MYYYMLYCKIYSLTKQNFYIYMYMYYSIKLNIIVKVAGGDYKYYTVNTVSPTLMQTV